MRIHAYLQIRVCPQYSVQQRFNGFYVNTYNTGTERKMLKVDNGSKCRSRPHAAAISRLLPIAVPRIQDIKWCCETRGVAFCVANFRGVK